MDELLRPIPIKDQLLIQFLQKIARYRLDRASISRLEYQKIVELLRTVYLSLPCNNEIGDLQERVNLAPLQELTALLSKIRQRSRSNYSMDEWFRELLQEVRQYKINTEEYQEALERLLMFVPLLPGIHYIDHPYYPNAIHKTLEAVTRKFDFWLKKPDSYIDEYPADKLRQHFVNWVNRFLKRKIIDECYRKLNVPPPLSLDCSINDEAGKTSFLDEQPDLRSLNDPLLDDPLEEIEQALLVVKRYIEIDPEGELRRWYTGCPECNCQTIANEVYLNPNGSATKLAAKFGILSNQNIYGVWRRHGEPILNQVFDNYERHRYVLRSVLSGWLENVIDSTWHTVETVIGTASPNFPLVFRNIPANGITMCKEINLGMVVGYPLALIVNVSRTEEEFNIVLRVCPTGEQKYLPPNLQVIVVDDESGESFSGDPTTDDSRYTQIKVPGMPGERFSVEISVGQASIVEKFVI
ncbi:DUF1822 family protein [Aerosakkonemataceae cyanobacterium BLCC-F50]|uniref:DUF1822 family protein n=1 Tax=Floridaenema flaviceps BLCC-F50 TaxID=3153642 RepID=A0ABV4XIS6_9CYAN